MKQNGGRVLVHCQAGISRSATICLAYLMHTRRVRLDEAFDFVKQRRQVISPNLAFMGQLLQFETDVLCKGWGSGCGEPLMSLPLCPLVSLNFKGLDWLKHIKCVSRNWENILKHLEIRKRVLCLMRVGCLLWFSMWLVSLILYKGCLFTEIVSFLLQPLWLFFIFYYMKTTLF